MKLGGIFKDNMVLQRDKEIRVFGYTNVVGDGNMIRARIKEGRKVLSKDATYEIYDDGFFLCVLPGLPAGGPYSLEVVSEAEGVEKKALIKNVYIGEVWIAGGQSNMEYPLGRSENASSVVPNCPETNIHFYRVPAADLYDDALIRGEDESHWDVINSKTCYDMSGVAFYFASKVEAYMKEHAEEGSSDLHFGIIGCYLGGTSVASWQSVEALAKTDAGKRFLEDFNEECSKWKNEDEYLTAEETFADEATVYVDKISAALKTNPYLTYVEADAIVGPGPWPPPVGPLSVRRPGALFDCMVLRIVPFSVRGVIFYQGEEDAETHYDDYAVVFKSMIDDWRAVFWDDDMPFLFCQLPRFTTRDNKDKNIEDYKWPTLRDQQRIVAETDPNTYMAVLIDCGEFDNVHPINKKTPGYRLADLALKFIYGFEEVKAVAPYLSEIKRGYGIEAKFDGDFERLDIKTRHSSDETGFELAGSDGVFVRADATVDFDGKTVHVASKSIPNPEYIRYAFFSYGHARLVSDAGLPASPFDIRIDPE